MNEKIVTFGKNNRLRGIITYPKDDKISSDKPAIIMLNVGLIHRVGPHRFHVDLARLLAEKNSISLRFDLSGIGDSIFDFENSEIKKYAISDTEMAMNYITSITNIKTFILIGICSGADNIHAITKINKRVIGCVFLDAYGYPTKLFNLHKHIAKYIYYLAAMSSMDKWISLFKKKINKPIYSNNNSSAAKIAILHSQRNWPDQKEAETDIINFLERGIKLLYIYSGGVPFYYNYKNQFYDMFPSIGKKRKILVKYFSKADHTFTSISQRKLMMKSIYSWLYDSF
jgi:hypothetical protein